VWVQGSSVPLEKKLSDGAIDCEEGRGRTAHLLRGRGLKFPFAERIEKSKSEDSDESKAKLKKGKESFR